MPAPYSRAACWAVSGLMLFSPVVSQLQAETFWSKVGRKCKPEAGCTVESLAQEMDWLEHFIDTQGTIAAKAPDIWGEQRLIKHRQEFEKQLAAEIGSFEVKLNAAVARSDQAFLSSATALSFAISSRRAGTRPPANGGSDLPAQDITIQANSDLSTANLVPVDSADPSKGYKLAQGTGGTAVIFRKEPIASSAGLLGFEGQTISLEPTEVIDQQKRFIDHLNAIRRLNEGDDISDTPCYSLNLVRIPISVLPGKQTRKGHGAEITITAEPVLSDTLLPTTMRRLIVNEVEEVFSVIIRNQLKTNCRDACVAQKKSHSEIQLTSATSEDVLPEEPNGPKNIIKPFITPVSPATSLISYSSLMEAFTSEDIEGIKDAVIETLRDTDRDTDILLDIRVGLQAEADAAYEMLMQPAMSPLWDAQKIAGLTEAIRTGCEEEIQRYRKEFFAHLTSVCCPPLVQDSGRKVDRPGDHVAWAVYYFAVLSNDRLIRDMREMGPALKCPQCNPDGMVFVGTSVPPEAAQLFCEYVKCRWPIRVFALDPVVDEQNVADAFSRRRELQLAMALKFVSGNMSASNLTKFVRRLEWDMNVIALNRTAIGFNHDNDTFGWRFYPRVQTPPVKGNIGTFVETWVGGPTTDQDLNKRQIEPGQRECIAIVLMPAFVPYVRFDTRSNWFKLTNPKATEVTIQDAMRMSQSIRRMTNVSQSVVDAHCYRDGEIERLQRRVDQLSKELPLQTLHAQTPVDIDVTAAEAFATGVEELTPVVYGAYGEPGVVLGQNTELFVVGRNFSVHDTNVIAGNRSCRFDLISRHIMKVTIPPDVRPVVDSSDAEHSEIELCSCRDQHVDLHVATPYGVSKHLKIPVVGAAEPTGVVLAFRPSEYMMQVGYTTDGTTKIFVVKPEGAKPFDPSRISIPWPSQFVDPGSGTITLQVFAPTGERIAVFTPSSAAAGVDQIGRQYIVNLEDAKSTIIPGLQSYITARKITEKSKLPTHVKITAAITLGTNVTIPVNGDANLQFDYLDLGP